MAQLGVVNQLLNYDSYTRLTLYKERIRQSHFYFIALPIAVNLGDLFCSSFNRLPTFTYRENMDWICTVISVSTYAVTN